MLCALLSNVFAGIWLYNMIIFQLVDEKNPLQYIMLSAIWGIGAVLHVMTTRSFPGPFFFEMQRFMITALPTYSITPLLVSSMFADKILEMTNDLATAQSAFSAAFVISENLGLCWILFAGGTYVFSLTRWARWQ